MKVFFKEVTIVKPTSSREASSGIMHYMSILIFRCNVCFAESFILCQNYSPPPNFVPTMIDFSLPNYGMIKLILISMEDKLIVITTGQVSTTNSPEIIPFVACGDLSALDEQG